MLNFFQQSAAMAAIFLGAKTEEIPKKIRDVCNVFWRLRLREQNLPLEVLDITKQVTNLSIMVFPIS